MSKTVNIDIIGAGISGLATAYYLSKLDKNLSIRVWEKDTEPGGLAGNFQTENFSVEKFYHHIYKRDKAIQNLISELGLSEYLKWNTAETGAYYFKQPYRLSSPYDILKFKPLSFLDRFRLAFMVLRARKTKNWDDLDKMSAKEYIVKYAGENVYRILWEPLLKGKFGRYSEDISAAWLCSKIIDRGGSRNRTGFEYLGYMDGGLGKVFCKLEDVIKEKGHSVNYNCPVTEIELNNQNYVTAIYTNKQRIESDLLIGCIQLPNLVDILPDGINEYKKSLDKIRFLGNVCLVLILKKSLSDFYWTNVTDPKVPFVGIIEHTKWADIKDNRNGHLVYISSYIPHEDKRLDMNTEELLNYYLPFVREIFPDFSKSDILESYKWYEPYTQPIVHTGYRNSIPEIQSPINNFLVCTMAQIYPHDRQVSNGVEMALKTVNMVREKFLN